MAEPDRAHPMKALAHRTLVRSSVAAAVVLVLALFWLAFDFFLLVFAAVLFGVLFHGAGRGISELTHMPYAAALATFFALLAAVLTGGVFLLAPNVVEQFHSLAESLPRAWEQLSDRASDSRWMQLLMSQRDTIRGAMETTGVVSTATTIMSSLFGAITSFFIALIIGICFSLNPSTYLNGFVSLLPLSYRARGREVLLHTGGTLQSWLLAKLLEMLVIGVFTTLGLWLIGLDLALVLGLIAGILSFIPNFGPIISIIPAILLASLDGMNTVLWVLGLYMGIQAVESWLLTPWLQHRIVEMPPAVTISVQLLFGILAGTLGLILATPLAAAVMVLTNQLYVRDVLGDESVDSPSSDA